MEKLPNKSVREKLSQWDSKLAVLDDFQKEGMIELGTAASQRPFPVGVSSSSSTSRHIYMYYVCISL